MVRHLNMGRVHSGPEWFDCCWPNCEDKAEAGGPPLCERHYVKVGERYFAEKIRDMAHGLGPAPSVHDIRAAQSVALDEQSQVYYVRTGDHVKIGYTVNMRQRLIQLRLDADAVLATEPGGRDVERQRHQEFAEERIGRRENFNPSRRLLKHIDQIRALYGDPIITTYPKMAQ